MRKSTVIKIVFVTILLSGLVGYISLSRWLRVYYFVGAAEHGDIQTIRHYIDGGIDVNAASKGGINAIGVASRNGHNEAIKLLLDAGASPNEGIYQAILTEHIDTIHLLLSRGANVNIADARHGISPLAFAKHNSSDKIVKLLESKQ